LHTALSPDGITVASLAADEQLCFWRVFEPSEKKKKAPEVGTKKLSTVSLR
jgi:WD40 repeat protein